MTDDKKFDLVKTAFDALPSLIFVVDEDVRVKEYNAAAAELLTIPRSAILTHRGGEVLQCLHSTDVPDGCGHGPSCVECVIRNSVIQAFGGNRVVRHRVRMELKREGASVEMYALVTASQFQYQGDSLVLLVIEDISEIAEFQRLIPICSRCRKIRDANQSWYQVETYFKEHWNVDFSHSFCPDCYKKEKEKLEKEIKELKGVSRSSD